MQKLVRTPRSVHCRVDSLVGDINEAHRQYEDGLLTYYEFVKTLEAEVRVETRFAINYLREERNDISDTLDWMEEYI